MASAGVVVAYLIIILIILVTIAAGIAFVWACRKEPNTKDAFRLSIASLVITTLGIVFGLVLFAVSNFLIVCFEIIWKRTSHSWKKQSKIHSVSHT